MRFLVKQGAYALAGAVLLTVFARMDYHRLRLLAPTLLVAALALCVLVLAVAPAVNGARRWFFFGPVSFQPSELAKVAVCIWVCAHLSRRAAPQTLGELMKPIGLVVALFAGLILVQPDLGTTISLMLMVAGVLLVSGLPLRVLMTAGCAALALGAAAIWIEPYRRARLFAFLDPTQDPQGAGYQTLQAVIGIGSGGLTGNGLGEGVQKINFLPEAHTDMIFAVVGEELGLVGSTAVVAAFVAFAWAGFRVALRCRDPFGKRLAVGITTLVCAQAAVNLAAVLGIAPLTGIPLPFVSYGGSSLVVLLAAVGVLLNIAVNERVVATRVSDRRRRNRRARAAGARGRRRPAGQGGSRDARRVARAGRVAAGS
jgi:cell division protein FtsW